MPLLTLVLTAVLAEASAPPNAYCAAMRTTQALNARPPDVYVAHSPVHGNGVFANRDFAADDVIEEAPVLSMDRTNALALANYVFTDPDDKSRVFLAFGYGSIYNHDDNPNARFELRSRDALTFEAARPIRKDEEITVDYGSTFWKYMDQVCDKRAH